MSALLPEVGMISFEDCLEYLLILRYEQVILTFKMSDYILGQALSQCKICLSLIEACTLD